MIGFNVDITFCSSLACLPPLIGSLPNLAATAASSSANCFTANISFVTSDVCSGDSVLEVCNSSRSPASLKSTPLRASAAFVVNLPCSALWSNSLTKLYTSSPDSKPILV